MRKTLLVQAFCLLAGLTAQVCVAQKTVTVYTIDGDSELFEIFAGTAVHGVSPNGRYAVGSDRDYSQMSFLWDRETGQFTLITGSLGDCSNALAVNDDGTVVGYFDYDNNGEVSEGQTAYSIPGVWKDGTWTALELETPMTLGTYNGEANTISADGRVITGYVNGRYYIKNENGVIIGESAKLRPAVWIDGVLQPMEDQPSTDEIGQGMYSVSASADGKVMAGLYDHPSGSRAPVCWIDGKMTYIYGEPDIDVDKVRYFFDGYVGTVSPNGKYVCGYWDPTGSVDMSQIVAFVYNTETGEKEEISEFPIASVVTDDHTVFGGSPSWDGVYVKSPEFTGTLAKYLTDVVGVNAPRNLPDVMMSVSKDKKTLGGWSLSVTDLGPMMMPTIVVINDPEDTGITSATADRGPLSLHDGICEAANAARIDVYDAAGRLLRRHEGHTAHAAAGRILRSHAGLTMDLSGLTGNVVVKATFVKGGSCSTSVVLK